MILIVDDHDDIRWALHRLLTFAGLEAMTAGSGLDALRIIRQYAPELVLLDVMMPNMDGLEVLRQIRADESISSIPVLLHTAGTYPADLKEARRIGADGMIKKGNNDIDELIGQIESLRNSRHSE